MIVGFLHFHFVFQATDFPQTSSHEQTEERDEEKNSILEVENEEVVRDVITGSLIHST
jgi:hypothetical protein